MAKTKKLRKEKYIKQKTVNGRLYLQVSFQFEDEFGFKQSYSKSFRADDYESPAAALDAACAHRDQMRTQLLHSGQKIRTRIDRKHTVDEAFMLIQQIFPKTLKTVKHRTITYRNYIQPAVGNKPIEEITGLDIQQTLNAMITSKSDDNISRVATCWRYIIRAAAFTGWINSDPMLQVVVPASQLPHKKPDVATDRETLNKVIAGIRQYTKNSDKYKFNAELIIYMLEIIYYTGIRPAECLGLDKSDIDLNAGYINIDTAQGSTAKEWNTQKATKTKQSVRLEPIVQQLEPILRELISMQPSDHLFMRCDNNTVWSIDDIDNKINYVCKRIGVKFNIYRLRHKFSTDLVTANVDPRTIMELMGHNNINQTLDYARSNDKLKRDALKNRKYS